MTEEQFDIRERCSAHSAGVAGLCFAACAVMVAIAAVLQIALWVVA